MTAHERIIELFDEALGVLSAGSMAKEHHERLSTAVRTSITCNLDDLRLERGVRSEARSLEKQLADLLADRPNLVLEVAPRKYAQRFVDRQGVEDTTGHQSSRGADEPLDLVLEFA